MQLIDAEMLRHNTNVWLDGTCLVMAVKDLDDAPTVDAAPVVHSEWIKYPHRWGFFICSRCKCLDEKYIPFDEKVWNYCPNCGAKMDGDVS